ncbi:MAG TPA: helix-turn-helix domain-containing protein [Microbacterium sp.]|nr:helix-turn-helix domain-containing protein [Microbacterium sp.]
MDLPSRADDVLAQPTRASLFMMLRDLRRPAGTDELAERLALHPNGVRVHLARLRDAGLVVRERSPRAPGRPRDMWLIAPDARPAGEPPTGYANLGRWLARVISPSQRTLRTVEEEGRQIGRDLGPKTTDEAGPAETSMHAQLVALGFQPRREVESSGALTYRLCNCPYREAVHENQAVVCTLHRGITRGLLDAIAPETELAGFVPRDPDTAGCLIELRGGLAGEPGDGVS